MPAPGPRQTAVDARTSGSKEMVSLPGGGVAMIAIERVPPEAGARGSRMSLWPLRLSRGDRNPSVLASAKAEKTSSTSMLSPSPPYRRHLFYSSLPIASHRKGAVVSVLGKRKAAGLARLVGAAAQAAVPAASEVVQWAREHLWCGQWDAWLRDLRACLPRAPPGLLERRLIQFLDWGVEAARDLRQPDFLPLIAAALSSLDPGVWESLLHDSTSPKLLMQRI